MHRTEAPANVMRYKKLSMAPRGSAVAGGAALVGAVVESSRRARKQAAKQLEEAKKAAAKAAKQAKKDAPKQLKAAKKLAAEQAAGEVLALPIYPELTEAQLDEVTAAVLAYLSM